MAVEPTVGEESLPRHGMGRVVDWMHRVRLERKLAFILLVAAVTSGVTTFSALTGNLPVAADAWDILLLLNLNLILLLCLGVLIARRLVILWMARRRGTAGARLHVRLVALFSLVAVTPTIIIALFSVMLFDFGLQGWFSKRVSTAIEESKVVAQAYLEEHQKTIAGDVLAMKQDLDRDGPAFLSNPQVFNRVVRGQARLRSLSEAVVFEVLFDGSTRILARTEFSLSLDFDLQIPNWAVGPAREGEVVILTPDGDDRVRALVRLDNFPSTYLYVGRLIDPRVLTHVDETQEAAQLYQQLEGKRADLQISFALVFGVVALLLLLAAVWVGLAFANQLTRPIRSLIVAADRVASGDLKARVANADERDEIGSLAISFNRMTDELAEQQRELLEANRQLDGRRRFIEAVLAGVSSGVLGIDRRGRITLPNRRACDLLGAAPDELQGKLLGQVLPELAEPLQAARRRPRRIIEQEILRHHPDGRPLTLFVRIAPELGERGLIGFVVTFDDISELLSAQRKAAWSDVARRIAHEIKNPLTPIQLSAERLKRKYLKQINEDPETFRICTDTIVRHVGDIGRMVDEFSAFARMPAPAMGEEDLGKLIEQAVFLQQDAHPSIAFQFDQPSDAVIAYCDAQQVRRALTNLLQNSIDSITARAEKADTSLSPGLVRVQLIADELSRRVVVEDNGRGLPKKERHRLTEPYVTTRDRGTGLGLAIVKKIMEDHGGHLVLEDNRPNGARVSLVFPFNEEIAGLAGAGETTSRESVKADVT